MTDDAEDSREPLVRCATCGEKLPGKDRMPVGAGIVKCAGCGHQLGVWEHSEMGEMTLKLGLDAVKAYWPT
jgi:DNA-directed RNA polymerase subunit RPC12/RpoP